MLAANLQVMQVVSHRFRGQRAEDEVQQAADKREQALR